MVRTGEAVSIDFAAHLADNTRMELLGHIQNGVVVFDGGTIPPEGTAVSVSPRHVIAAAAREGKLIEFPIVRDGEPGSWILTNEMIADFFEQEDIEYMKGMFDVPS